MLKKLIVLTLALILAGGCSKTPPPSSGEPMVTVNGEAVSNDEVALALRLAIESAEAYGSYVIDWDGEMNGVPSGEYIRGQALELIAEFRSIAEAAERFGCTLTEEEQADIDSLMSQEADFSGGKEAFSVRIAEQYGTMELYRFYMYEAPYLYDKLSVALFSEGGPYGPSRGDVESYYKECYRNCAYILLSALDDDGYPLEGEELDTMRSVAEALRKQAAEGADFLELVARHGQDYIMSVYPEGRPIPLGLHGGEFDEALAALEVNGVSGVVCSGDALYVIKRLPEDGAYLADNYDEILDDYVSYKFQELISEWRGELAVSASKAYNELDPTRYEPGVG